VTPQELKNSILQLAIQGKLVEQRPEEESAVLLLSKKAKKPITNSDAFDIPEKWCWAVLPDIAEIIFGFPFNSEKFNEDNIGEPIIRIRDIISGKTKTYSNEKCDKRYRIKRGDMLVGMDGNFQVAFWNSEDAWLNQRVCKISADSALVSQRYLFFYLPIILSQINSSVSYSTVKHLSAKILNGLPIPLPPLAEQKRIVAKIEELLPLIERYEVAWTKLEDFNKRFPIDMQKSILQMAIHGKLVSQDPSEGTGEELYKKIQAEKQELIKAGKIKKEKALPEIAPDEVPFDIPESWRWARYSEVMLSMSTGPFGSMLHKSDYISDGIPLVNPANIINGKILPSNKMMVSDQTKERLCSYILHKNMIVIGRRGEMGRCAVVTDAEDGWLCGTGSFFMEPSSMIYAFYITKLFSTPYVKTYLGGESVGTTMSNLNHSILSKVPIPLPPLAEQKRIVAKLEELLPLCEKLTK